MPINYPNGARSLPKYVLRARVGRLVSCSALSHPGFRALGILEGECHLFFSVHLLRVSSPRLQYPLPLKATLTELFHL